MSVPYVLTPEAQAHVDEIGAYIARHSVDAALRVYDEFEAAFELLAERPGIGHTRADLTNRTLKFWSLASYLIVYDPASRPLTILAVLHGSRDVERLLRNPQE